MSYSFFATINRMKYIQRWGLMRNSSYENDMEHSFQVAMIAHAIAVLGNTRFSRQYNPEHIMAIALYHDAGEVITGDMPTPIKHNNPYIRQEYGKLEKIARQKLLASLPEDLQPAFQSLLEAEAEAPDAWQVVKAADRISAYIKCIEERKAGNEEFHRAEQSILQDILDNSLPEAQLFLTEFGEAFGQTLDEISQ